MFRNDLAEPMICRKDDSNTCGERFDESYTTLARVGRTVYGRTNLGLQGPGLDVEDFEISILVEKNFRWCKS